MFKSELVIADVSYNNPITITVMQMRTTITCKPNCIKNTITSANCNWFDLIVINYNCNWPTSGGHWMLMSWFSLPVLRLSHLHVLFRSESFGSPAHISWVSDWLIDWIHDFSPWASAAMEAVTETEFGTKIAYGMRMMPELRIHA